MGKIAIIEDVKFISFSLINILHELQYKNIDTFQTNEQLQKLLKQESLEDFDLFFISHSLNIKDNTSEVAQIIKQLKSLNENLTIVLIANQGDKQEVLKNIEAGASDILEKPISLESVKKLF